MVLDKADVRHFHDLYLAKRKTFSFRLYLFFKRLLDILVAVIGIILGTPIVLFFGILQKIESPGPILYKQTRVGQYGVPFTIYKVRSMIPDAEAHTGPVWAKKEDPRVTRVGKIIRKTRIDEIPQFLNILKGEMSLVGPRPERPELVSEFEKDIPGFSERTIVKPGVTGWAQINGGYDVTPEEKFYLDLEYIEDQNIWLDLKIILKTIYVVIFRHGAR